LLGALICGACEGRAETVRDPVAENDALLEALLDTLEANLGSKAALFDALDAYAAETEERRQALAQVLFEVKLEELNPQTGPGRDRSILLLHRQMVIKGRINALLKDDVIARKRYRDSVRRLEMSITRPPSRPLPGT